MMGVVIIVFLARDFIDVGVIFNMKSTLFVNCAASMECLPCGIRETKCP